MKELEEKLQLEINKVQQLKKVLEQEILKGEKLKNELEQESNRVLELNKKLEDSHKVHEPDSRPQAGPQQEERACDRLRVEA